MLIHSVHRQVFPFIQGLATMVVSETSIVQNSVIKGCFVVGLLTADSYYYGTKLTGEMAEVLDLSSQVLENVSYSRCDTIIICLLNNRKETNKKQDSFLTGQHFQSFPFVLKYFGAFICEALDADSWLLKLYLPVFLKKTKKSHVL